MKKAPISGSFFVLTNKKKELRFEVRELRFRGFAALLQNPSVTAVTSPFEKGDYLSAASPPTSNLTHLWGRGPSLKLLPGFSVHPPFRLQ